MGFGIGGSLSGLTSGITKTVSSAGKSGSSWFSGIGDSLGSLDLAGVGSILAGAGSIGGALGQVANPGISQHKYDTRHLSWLVEGARRAGIHPLYALGQSTYPITGSGMGDALSALGQGVANAGSAASQYSADKRAKARLDADIRESQARTLAAQGSAARDFALASEANSRVKRAEAKALVSPSSLPATFRPADVVPVPPSKPQHYLPGPFGFDVPIAPGMTAEEGERHFGDIAQEVLGIIRLIEGYWNMARDRGPRGSGAGAVPPDAWGGP